MEQTLAAELRKRFAQDGRTQAEFARWLGITQVYLSYILSGKRRAGLGKAAVGILRRYPDLLPYFIHVPDPSEQGE